MEGVISGQQVGNYAEERTTDHRGKAAKNCGKGVGEGYREGRVIDRLKERDTEVSGTRGSRSDRQRMFYGQAYQSVGRTERPRTKGRTSSWEQCMRRRHAGGVGPASP